ncbi:hypothetical protein Trco_006989, partial [Trichoderma cornu-damae]
HRTDCKGPLARESWQPAWAREDRKPAFVRDDLGLPFGPNKYLWGNVPALDILRLGSNEGDDYDGDLSLLFAASGDLRNVVMTIARLPSSYKRSIKIAMNDRDLDIVARNAILLLIALVVENVDEAVDHMIHIWYSAFVRKSDAHLLERQIRPLVHDVCEKIKDKPPTSLLEKTWTFKGRSLRVALCKSSWDKFLSHLDVPVGLTTEQAHRVRTASTLAESRRDYLERRLYAHSPAHRVAFHQFRVDGLLLPFGSPRDDFREPNPTFFQGAGIWPMNDNADPLHGWSSEEVAETSSGAAAADMYGKLFYYLRALLGAFLARLSDTNISFRLLQADVLDLPDRLAGETFSRIEVSNIADAGYLGIHRTLAPMVPLLQTPLVNKHATLITLFMNAIIETMTEKDKKPNGQAVRRLLQYLPQRRVPISAYDPDELKLSFAIGKVLTYNHVLDRYLNGLRFRECGDLVGAAMKEEHTIVEKWPYRLKLRPGQPGAQEEFDRLMTGSVSGKEFYVEWSRVRQGVI